MNDFKVSVIIPVYNAEKYLKDCLDAISNQTLKEIEIICVDDGSTDNSSNILRDYAKNDGRFKIITQENKDVGAARGAGVKIANGEYIAFSDNDDFLVSDALEKLYYNAKSNASDLVLFNVGFFYTDNDRRDYPSYYNLNKYFEGGIDFNSHVFIANEVKPLIMSNFEVWHKFYSTDFLKKYADFYFKEKNTIPDVPLHVQVMLRANRISFLPEHLYFYRKNHSESMLNISKDTDRVFDIFEVIDEVEKFLRKNKYMAEYEKEFIIFKIKQIQYWFKRCGIHFQNNFFNKSKIEFLKLDLNAKNILIIPKICYRFYENVINSNSYRETELLENIEDIKMFNIKKIKKYQKEIKKLKKLNKEMTASNSWKITKPFRHFVRFFKK